MSGRPSSASVTVPVTLADCARASDAVSTASAAKKTKTVSQDVRYIAEAAGFSFNGRLVSAAQRRPRRIYAIQCPESPSEIRASVAIREPVGDSGRHPDAPLKFPRDRRSDRRVAGDTPDRKH